MEVDGKAKIIGFDQVAFFHSAEAMGMNKEIVASLLPYAESGMVLALNGDVDGDS